MTGRNGKDAINRVRPLRHGGQAPTACFQRLSSDAHLRTTSALKDLLDAFHLLGSPAEVVLFAVSIVPLQELGDNLSEELAMRMGEIVGHALAELERQDTAAVNAAEPIKVGMCRV